MFIKQMFYIQFIFTKQKQQKSLQTYVYKTKQCANLVPFRNVSLFHYVRQAVFSQI